MSDAAHTDLQDALLELRRHLAWQESEGVSLVLRNLPERSARPPVAASPAREAAPNPIARFQQGPAPRAAAPPSAGTQPAPAPRADPRPAPLEGEVTRYYQSALPEAARAPMPIAAKAVPAPSGDAPIRTLDEVRRELGDCQRCKLCSGRKQIVFGAGSPRAQLVFVGEGPGSEEDAQGVPFVGPAGQLLTKMIEAMGFSRDEVYICNVVKCRPPNNRNPEPDEIAACEPFLKAQLQALQPKAIVALGKFAAQTLLRDQTPITRMRGNWREYQGVPLMPTFHPAYLLRTPADKKLAWSDLQQVMKLFGKVSPAKGG